MREWLRFIALAVFVACAGIWCTFADAVRDRMSPRRMRGKASWYGEGYRGSIMANGQPFDPDARTCATNLWPLGSVLRVRCVSTGRIVFVTVTDRGPAEHTGCVIDLSRRAFLILAPLNLGHVAVEIEFMPDEEDESFVRSAIPA